MTRLWPRSLTVPRPPDFVITTDGAPYLRRWHVLPQNRFLNVYLHHFLRSDDPRALHDHPWASVSVILRGRYWEVTPDGFRLCLPFRPVFRRASAAHRVFLDGGRPAWTLFVTGPKVREWGFHCPNGWRHWKDYCLPGDAGQVGPGCE